MRATDTPKEIQVSAANDRADEAQRRIDSVLNDVFSNIEPGDEGDGDNWFVAGLHSPDMPEGGLLTFTSMPFMESVGAAMLLRMAFATKLEQQAQLFHALGFSDDHVGVLVSVETYRRHYMPETAPAQVCRLLDAAMQQDVCEDGTMDPADRAPIETLLNQIQNEAAMSGLAGDWGSDRG